jgi:hypothetical protein
MSSLSPPALLSSLPLPAHLLAPPAMPLLSDCFSCGSVDLGKYILYSSALSKRACWHTSLAMSLGGQGTLLFLTDNNTDNAIASREQKTRIQRFIYVQRDTPDGPLEIISPEESMWYKFYIRNFYINKDAKLQKAFCNCFRLPYNQYLELLY